MKRGIYSATIALTALVLMIAIIATTGQRVIMEEDAAYANAVISVKTQWQNARYALDKTASDAIADSILNSPGCNYDKVDVETKVNNYFSGALAAMWSGECSATIDSFNGNNRNSIKITATITCEKNLGGKFSASYEKEIKFDKKVEIITSVPCNFKVSDNQSGIDDVTYP